MNSPEPRLNKLPFIVTDACCLVVVALIGLLAKDPFAPLYFVTAVSLVVIGAIALIIPYLADFAADSRESSVRLREQMEGQIARLTAAGDSLARAAAQIKAVEEAVHKSARDAETLPYRMQEKLAEFNEALAEKENEDREALERELEELRAANSGQLKAVAEKISKATTDWMGLETATRKQLAAAQDALAKLQSGTGDATAKLEEKLSTFARYLDERMADLNRAPAATPAKAPHPPEPESTSSLETSQAIASFARAIASEPSVASVEPASLVAETAANGDTAAHTEAKPRKPRAPRKAKPEETLAAMSETFVEPVVATDVLPETPVPAEGESNSAATPVEGELSSSTDGATRLLATAYIGIGNKLFIRGDGPGLSWDRGIPMQFVSIGKWGWHTHDAAGPVRIKLYKNDESAALSGELTLNPGRHTEITALF